MNFKGQEIIAEVSLEAETPPQKIGTLSCRSKALCWDEGWKTKFFKRSEELTEEVLHFVLEYCCFAKDYSIKRSFPNLSFPLKKEEHLERRV